GRRGGGSPRAELTERGPTSHRGARTVVRSRVAARFGRARSPRRTRGRGARSVPLRATQRTGRPPPPRRPAMPPSFPTWVFGRTLRARWPRLRLRDRGADAGSGSVVRRRLRLRFRGPTPAPAPFPSSDAGSGSRGGDAGAARL